MRVRRLTTQSEKLAAVVVLFFSTLLIMYPSIFSFFMGCPPPGNPSVTISGDADLPTFDFLPKRRSDVHDPFGYDVWQIWKLDNRGKKVKCIWEIAPPNNGPYFLNSLKYSQVPESWNELKPAEPLEIGNTFYLTAGGFIFRRNKSSTYTVLPGNYYTSAEIEKRLTNSISAEL